MSNPFDSEDYDSNLNPFEISADVPIVPPKPEPTIVTKRAIVRLTYADTPSNEKLAATTTSTCIKPATFATATNCSSETYAPPVTNPTTPKPLPTPSPTIVHNNAAPITPPATRGVVEQPKTHSPPSQSRASVNLSNSNNYVNNNASTSSSVSVGIQTEEFNKSAAVQQNNRNSMEDVERLRLLEIIDKLSMERDKLRHHIEQYNKPSPESAISQMVAGRSFNLNCFKSIEDKSKLLELAVTSYHSNTILYVIHFIKETLSPNLYGQLISKYEEALSVYAKYLKDRSSLSTLISLYRFLNRPTEEAMTLLYAAYKIKEPVQRLNAFKQCVEIFSKHKKLEFQLEALKEQILLLERQLPIEEHDSKVAVTESIFLKFPRNSIIYAPLSYTLYYSFFYHPNAPKDKLSSPFNMKTTFRISDKRFTRSQLSARSKIGDWETVKDMINSKKSIFSKGPKSDIGFEPFVEAVFDNQGPLDLLKYFLNLIENSNRKYQLSIKYKLWDIAVDTIIQLKDRDKANHLKLILSEEMSAQSSLSYREKLDKIIYK